MAVFSLHHFRLFLNRRSGVFLLLIRIKPIFLFRGKLCLKKVQFKDKLERGMFQSMRRRDMRLIQIPRIRSCPLVFMVLFLDTRFRYASIAYRL